MTSKNNKKTTKETIPYICIYNTYNHITTYKSNDRKFKRGEPCMQEHLYEYFYSDGHNGFLEHVAITLINKTDGGDP